MITIPSYTIHFFLPSTIKYLQVYPLYDILIELKGGYLNKSFLYKVAFIGIFAFILFHVTKQFNIFTDLQIILIIILMFTMIKGINILYLYPQSSVHPYYLRFTGAIDRKWTLSSNVKDIGTLYLIFALFSGLIVTAFSVLIKLELSGPGVQYIANNHFYNAILIIHSIIMVFFVVIPAMVRGFGNFFLPLLVGGSDMAFPRPNRINF